MEQSNNTGAPKPKRRRRKRRFSFLRLIGGLFLTIFTIGVVGIFTLYLFLQIFMNYINTSIVPTVNVTVEELTMAEASTIYYQDNATGEWVVLDTLFAPQGNRQIVEYNQLPKHLIDALVAIEDQRFWTHHGVDWEGTAAAFYKTFATGTTRGGSTITQQLLRNLTQDDDPTFKRKVREIFRALEFEKTHSKEDIITLYLNYVYFGAGCDGIQTAAQTYFGKDVSELTLAESASIVAITNNPSLYDPFYDVTFKNGKTPRMYNKERQELILDVMASEEIGYITQAEADAAKKEFLLFTDTPQYAMLHQNEEDDEVTQTSNVYSWFTDLVVEDAIRLIREAKGCDEKMATTLLYSAGYHIYTTLDMDIQKIVDKVYLDTSNFDYPSAAGTPLDSAISIIDPYTGNIVAIAGGVGEKTLSRAQNLATRPRPCGSAIKPISVYAPAIDANIISPGSVIDDYPMLRNEKSTGGGSTSYTAWPRNSNNKYRGYSTVEYSVQWSLNTVATRVLDMLGTEESFEFMENNLGFDLHINDNDLAPLAMGGLTYGVSTVDMAAAFASFANSGIYSPPRTITQILGNDGKEIVVDNTIVESRMAMKESTAYLMNNMLRKVVSSGTGASASFDGMAIAGKTGTTSNNFDRYFVGYTPYYSAAVWVGYAQSNEKINSGTKNPAALVWKMIMEEVHKELEKRSFPEAPSNIVKVRLCSDCGMLATTNCENEARGNRTFQAEIQESAKPTEQCTCHIPVRVCYNAVNDQVHLAGPYCPDETCFEQIWLKGREFMFLPSANPTVYEDGTTDPGTIVLSTDADFHYTYRVTQPTCPYHTEPIDPTLPDEEEPPVPGDEDYEWGPDWWEGGEPLDPDTPLLPPDEPNEGDGNSGNNEDTEDNDTIPDEPDEPDVPDEPDEPTIP